MTPNRAKISVKSMEEEKIDSRGFTLKDFEQIPALPVYKCTETEFKDPMKLIAKLRELGYETHGCVKLVPPKSFKIPFCFDGKGKLLTTRKQVLQDLTKAKVRLINSVVLLFRNKPSHLYSN